MQQSDMTAITQPAVLVIDREPVECLENNQTWLLDVLSPRAVEMIGDQVVNTLPITGGPTEVRQ